MKLHRKAHFQCLAGVFHAESGVKAASLIMPLAPITSPEKSKRMAAETPIKEPPKNPSTRGMVITDDTKKERERERERELW